MERMEWLKRIQSQAESLYDHIAPQYWETFGLEVDETHRVYLQIFLDRMPPRGVILSAACGAGRFDGTLLEAGHSVVGIDQSAGMLARARDKFPEVQYTKMSLQEIDFQEMFDGIICMDAMEHIPPEDYPGILLGFQKSLKPQGLLYFTADREEEPDFDLDEYYERAKALGLPVVYGEVTDEAAYKWAIQQSNVSGDDSDIAVYHYYPPLEKVREWINQAGFTFEEDGSGDGFHHFLLRKDRAV